MFKKHAIYITNEIIFHIGNYEGFVVLVEISGKLCDLPVCSVAHLTFQGKLFVELSEADAS